MRSARICQRAGRLDQLRQTRKTERCLQCLAAGMELDPELLRSEAIALVERFAEAGVTRFAENVARVAAEAAMPVEELRREVDEMMACCR